MRALSRSRSFDEFFGQQAAMAFWEALQREYAKQPDGSVIIDLEHTQVDPLEFANAFTILIDMGDNVARRPKNDLFKDELRQKFLDCGHRTYHRALFDLAKKYDQVWVEGEGNYGIRVAHTMHDGGVSVLTS